MSPEPLIFALPKGRIATELVPLLARVGIEPEPDFFDDASRKLQFATNQPSMQLIRVRSFDVATFVAFGAAQLGVVGSDVLEEFDYAELYAPLDLGIGRCRLSLASPAAPSTQPPLSSSHLRVATKYPAFTKRYFAARGIQPECIKLNGAMELAPKLGLADSIVDLVSTGSTLRANGLQEEAVMLEVSSRLIVNRAALKTRNAALAPLIDRFAEAMKG
jgi:ATP phosphoribosyltransferase